MTGKALEGSSRLIVNSYSGCALVKGLSWQCVFSSFRGVADQSILRIHCRKHVFMLCYLSDSHAYGKFLLIPGCETFSALPIAFMISAGIHLYSAHISMPAVRFAVDRPDTMSPFADDRR